MYDNASSRVIEIDIDEILPNRFQPRIQFDEEEILELSDSIKEHGVIQPLVVRTIGDKYEIIAGERRYKASVLAGKETVPVIVKNLNDKDSAEIALIENIQRKNLTPIEEALSYKKILDMGYITQENLATKLGKSQSAVANKIRLLNLSDEVQEALLENKISERHARSLLKLTTSKQQNEMLNKIIDERLTVRRADEEIEKLKNNPSNDNFGDEKIIEKGETNMNNNIFGIPSVPQNDQPVSNFNNLDTAVPQPEVVQTSMPSFDIFGTNTMQPMAEVSPIAGIPSEPQTVPEIPAMPSMPEPTSVNLEPIMPEVSPTAGIPSEPQTVPEIPAMPSMPEPTSVNLEPIMPEVSPIVDIPSEPQTIPEIPTMPSMPEPTPVNLEPIMPEVSPIVDIPSEPQTIPETSTIVPQTTPIMDSPVVDNAQMTQQAENLFSFGDNNINVPEIQSIPEFKMPEPIIVTDYSKQYNPVMPQTIENQTPMVGFKEVINAIRECSNKIEQYGFKIELEEFDLENLYQVIFKIEK